ncbi:MAG: putative lipid II flippase FtsW [Pseudolysinimonas sp.]|uniref:putative lipid II flippase FtsW n=1 Tax=Pseudolysinimonas sp. TaxID=2680009 RepID=UPI003262FD81
MLLGTTLFLLAFGLVMVLSSSSIESRVDDGDFFAQASRQGIFALVGIPVMLIASRAPVSFWRRWAWHAVGIGLLLQLLVFTPLGFGNGYNTNWLRLGSFTLQPSEFIKFALVVWLAWVLTTKRHLLDNWRHVALPIFPVAGLAIVLVLLGNDLGTALILLAIVLGALFFAGVRLRIILAALAAVALPGWIAISVSASRSGRFDAWLAGCDPKKLDPVLYGLHCWQSVNGWEALAHGGVFGVGLGNSAAKWAWLPAADNDFIFAIIGEELGLVGCILVLILFVLLAICFIRIIRMVRDLFAKTATSVAMVWIIGQAFVNIAVVLGVLPVLGVPLPLVSSGGSALITTMAAIGVVLSFARTSPRETAISGRLRGASADDRPGRRSPGARVTPGTAQ